MNNVEWSMIIEALFVSAENGIASGQRDFLTDNTACRRRVRARLRAIRRAVQAIARAPIGATWIFPLVDQARVEYVKSGPRSYTYREYDPNVPEWLEREARLAHLAIFIVDGNVIPKPEPPAIEPFDDFDIGDLGPGPGGKVNA